MANIQKKYFVLPYCQTKINIFSWKQIVFINFLRVCQAEVNSGFQPDKFVLVSPNLAEYQALGCPTPSCSVRLAANGFCHKICI